MRISVEAWAPEYGGSLDLGLPDEASTEKVVTDCELERWHPIAPGDPARPAKLAFVDGTRRIDARLFVTDGDQIPTPGVAGSVGVGAVLCTNGNTPKKAEVTELRVSRHLAVGDGKSVGISAGAGLEYKAMSVPGTQVEQLVDAVHNEMRVAEARLAVELAQQGTLVFADGPLAVMDPGPARIIGYIKAHARRYLPPEEESVLAQLGCGDRTPLFCFGEMRTRYSWYVRLCAPEEGMHGWYGLARCEVPAALPLEEAIELATLSQTLLPPYASIPLWDKRAPQNLVPIAGLEKRMRHLLGDRELVYRMIRSAAMRATRREGEDVA